MEIPSNELRKVTQQKVPGKHSAKKGGDVPVSSEPLGSEQSEQINVSSKAKDIQQAHEAIKSAPEVRVEKVNRIKKEIAEGKFKVDNEELAGKILKDIITERNFLE